MRTNCCNYYIINLDGLDVSGKETFSKNLAKYLEDSKEQFNHEAVKKWEVRVVSFPDYNGIVGEDIKNELAKPIEDRDEDVLDYLFKLDRKFKMREVMKEVKDNPDKFFIIILDRYYLSNLIYSLAHLIFVKHRLISYDFHAIEESKPWKQYYDERSYLPIPNITVIFSYGKPDDEASYNKAKQKHVELIREKSGKDSNETPVMQNCVDLVINDVLEKKGFWDGAPLSKINIRIGSNFGNDTYEYLIREYICDVCYMWYREYSNNQ